MLKQMGKACLAFGFMLRANVIPHGDRNNGRLAVSMDDNAQAIWQSELLMRDVHLFDQLGDRHRGLHLLRQHGRRENGGGHQGKSEKAHLGSFNLDVALFYPQAGRAQRQMAKES